MDCPFCNDDIMKIVLIEQKPLVKVIFSDPRLMPGHILVIPNRHVQKLSELTDDEKCELLDTLQHYQEKILKNISGGCDIRQNYRPFQKQDKFKVHHMHFHLQPRTLFDELYEKCQIHEKNVFKDLDRSEIDKFKVLLNK